METNALRGKQILWLVLSVTTLFWSLGHEARAGQAAITGTMSCIMPDMLETKTQAVSGQPAVSTPSRPANEPQTQTRFIQTEEKTVSEEENPQEAKITTIYAR